MRFTWQPERFAVYAPLLLRVGIGFVFIWSGLEKLVGSGDALGVCTNRAEAVSLVESFLWLPFDPEMFVFVQSIIELVLGALLVLGFKVRLTAVGVAVLLASFFVLLDFNLIWKNVALLGAALALILLPRDPGSLDAWLEKRQVVVKSE